jgi:hypothetical protein
MSNYNNYWASSPFPHPVDYPKWVYHATEPAKRVNSPEELAALGEGWSGTYIHHAFPKTKFRLKAEPKEGEPLYETTIVEDPEAEGKLEGGWSDAPPAAHGPAKHPQARPAADNPPAHAPAAKR